MLHFYMRNGVLLNLPVLDPTNFNMALSIKIWLADHHMMSPGLYINMADVVAIGFNPTAVPPADAVPPLNTAGRTDIN